MKTGGGDFSAEAYEQLREAYNKEQQRQVDDELAGTEVMGQQYGLETVPVDSPWADKIDLWKYPDGNRPHEDNKQSPDEILQIMRDSAQERLDAKKETEEVEEEEEVTAEVETEDEEDTETETETEEDEEESEEEEEEVEEEEESEEDEEDEEEEDEEEEEEVEEEEEDDLDAEAIASQIAELRSELEAMNFVPEEEPEADDESE